MIRWGLALVLAGCAVPTHPSKAEMGCDFFAHARDWVAYRACRDTTP